MNLDNLEETSVASSDPMLNIFAGVTAVSLTRNQIHLGDLRRLSPISRVHGTDRGLPIDRHYIEGFLSTNISDVKGHVLEFDDDSYTRRYGGERVAVSDVLHVEEGHPGATIIADLSSAGNIEDDTFDCIICTQTLMYIYPIRAAIQTLYRILKPGGVLLATFPGIAQVSRYDMDRWGEYWRFTTMSAKRLFGEVFPLEYVSVESRGNVLAAIAFLHGLCTEDLEEDELKHCDPDYEVLARLKPQTDELYS
jgi:SAM-dependent methyltransferase